MSGFLRSSFLRPNNCIFCLFCLLANPWYKFKCFLPFLLAVLLFPLFFHSSFPYSVPLSIYLSLSPSIYLSLHMSVHPSVYAFICPSILQGLIVFYGLGSLMVPLPSVFSMLYFSHSSLTYTCLPKQSWLLSQIKEPKYTDGLASIVMSTVFLSQHSCYKDRVSLD